MPTELSFCLVYDLMFEDIWKFVNLMAQSAEDLNIAQRFDIHVFNIAVSSGRGRVSN